MKPVVFYDTETAGLEMHHPIIQLAAVACDENFKVLDTYETKLTFDMRSADPAALEINHYTEAKWRDAISPAQCADEFYEFLKPFCCIQKVSKKNKPYQVAQLCGYNAAVFDQPRLFRLFKSVDKFLPANPMCLDTMQLAAWYFTIHPDEKPDSMKLSSACEAFGIEIENAHDALGDVVATAKLTRAIQNALGFCARCD